jgi:hypothetical protein
MEKKKLYFLLILIIFLISYSTLRFGFGFQLNQTHHMYLRMEDPNYLSNDWFTNNVDHFNARTHYLYFISEVNNIFNNIELTYFILYLVFYSLIFINIFYLTQLFFKNEKKSFFVTCLSFIAMTFSLDLTDLTKLIITPATISWCFSLISINLYFRKKYWIAYFMAGIASLFQVVIGSITFGVLLGDVLFRRPLIDKQKLINFLKTIPFFILSAISVIPLLILNKKTSNPQIAEYSSYIMGWFAHPGHILPSSWASTRYIVFFLFMAFFYLAFKKSGCNKNYKEVIRNFVIVVIAFCFIGYLFVEVIPLSFIIKMQLFRATIILNIFGYIFVGGYIYGRINKAQNFLEKAFFIILPLTFLSPFLVMILIPTFLVLELLKKINCNVLKRLSKDKSLLLFVCSMGIIFATIIFNNFLGELIQFIPSTFHTTIAYMAAPLLFYILALLFLKVRILRKIVLLFIVVLTVTTFLFYSPLERYYNHDEETKELFSFMELKTSKNNIILWPPYLGLSHLEISRAFVVDTRHPYTDRGIVEWYGRIQDVSNGQFGDPKTSDKKKLKLYYHTLNKLDLLKLKQKYNFSYVIFENSKELPLHKVFQNKRYVVYEI